MGEEGEASTVNLLSIPQSVKNFVFDLRQVMLYIYYSLHNGLAW